MGAWETVLEKLCEAVFPSNIYCICCGSMIDGTRPYSICDECAGKLHWINGAVCEKCGKALPKNYRGRYCYDCMSGEHRFKKAYSCFTYGLHEREMILDFKYNGRGYIGKKFGDMMYDRILCENLAIDVIIPVPLYATREKQRGYNQSEVMAGRLGERLGIPMRADLLHRIQETSFLRSLNPAERAYTLEGAFSVETYGKNYLREKNILLIDDIYTTGATVDECSKMLKEAGAGDVYVMTLASGGNRGLK